MLHVGICSIIHFVDLNVQFDGIIMWYWVLIILAPFVRGQPSISDLVNEAVLEAERDTAKLPAVGPPGPGGQPGAPGSIGGFPGNFTRNANPEPPSRTSTRLANLFNGQVPTTRSTLDSAKGGIVAEKALNILQGRSFNGVPLTLNDVKKDVAKKIEPMCGVNSVNCDSDYPYRLADGTCNNLFQVRMGAADTPQSRFVDPEYGDPWNWGFVPRIRGQNNQLLPNPRDISNVIFNGDTSSPNSDKFNVALTHFGQFVDHDVILTPIFVDPGDKPIECCQENNIVVRPECFPFTTPPGEFKYTCMNFVRSRPACEIGRRHQVNLVTSWLDLSSVYGSRDSEQKDLRSKSGGLMKVGNHDLLPDGVATCKAHIHCFKAGDVRNSEIPLLTLMHTIFLREHNRIAQKLSNKGWDDEKTFQETRKILTGMYQHIVFNEFLPALLGFNWAKSIGLISRPSGHIHLYSSAIDGATRNEFGAAAFRMGHSLVGNLVGAADDQFHQVKVSPLKDEFFDTGVIRDDKDEFGVQRIGRWMSATYGQKLDRFIANQLRNHLFAGDDPKDALDLGSLNINRGRDHGIPGYNKFREYCGLYPAAYFSSLPGGFIDHSYETVAKLSALYSHVDDVDLFVGAISETPESPETVLGPTFRCLFALQFLHYKYADRFFYENYSPTTGFTVDQVNDIKKQTLAGIYCRTLKIQNIQPNIFINPVDPYQRISCDDIPDLTFDLY